MARKLRVEYEGAIYHVTIRGVERRTLFEDDEDRRRFVSRLGEGVEQHRVRLYLFCLMSNHVHLLVETPQANLSAFMHQLETAYTVYFNRRHSRVGHLMQGRFRAEPVEGGEYLLRLSRYIHLNPVFIGAVRKQPLNQRRKELRTYRWSSYRAFVGLEKGHDFVDEAPILAMMEVKAKKQRATYQQFVKTGMAKTDEEFLEVLKASPWGVGGKEFRDRMRGLYAETVERGRRPEDASFRRVGAQKSAEEVVKAVAQVFGIEAAAVRRRRYNCVARAVAALMLGRYAGMNQRDIGVFLGMGVGSSVCKQLKRLRERLDREESLAEHVARANTALAIVKG
jgi:putative transposase